MRPGQQHNKRGRGRNRHRSGGGGGGGGGGNPLNRVYDSNGPDVKVRGTAQTVAEKYLQLGRDAQSSGDNVMAESYYQHAEHYLRIVAAAQAYQQQIQPQFRRPDEFDDEDGEEMGEGEADETGSEPAQAAPQGSGEQPDIAGEPAEFDGERQQPQQNYRPNREFRDRDAQGGRDQQQGRFRPRWQDRRDRQQGFGGESREQGFQPREQAPPPRIEEAAREPATANAGTGSEAPQWEAPSFLRRPAPAPAPVATPAEAPAEAAAPAPERKARPGRPRRERPAEGDAPPPDRTPGD